MKVSITYMAQYVRTWKYKLRYLQCHFNRHVMDSFNFVWVALINRKEDMEIPITNMSHHWTCSNQKDIKQHHEQRIVKYFFLHQHTQSYRNGIMGWNKRFFFCISKNKKKSNLILKQGVHMYIKSTFNSCYNLIDTFYNKTYEFKAWINNCRTKLNMSWLNSCWLNKYQFVISLKLYTCSINSLN